MMRVYAECFMQFYGKPIVYLLMRNQWVHFSPFLNRRILTKFYKPFYLAEV